MSNNPKKGNDVMIAVGAALCIALGAAMTYMVTHKQPEAPSAQAAPHASKQASMQEGQPSDPATGELAAQEPAPGTSDAAKATQQSVQTPASEGSSADFAPLAFSTLASYYYELPSLDDGATKVPKEQIPQPIKNLNRKRIALQGFMVPIDLRDGKTTKFLLVKDQSLCCFGRMPRMNEWVSVNMIKGNSARVISDQPVTVFGVFNVGEKIENGEVTSIYRLDSEDVAGPLDL